MIRTLPLALSLALLGGTTAFAASPAPAPSAPSPVPTTAADAANTAKAADWVRALQAGKIDRTALTPEMSKGLTPALVATLSTQLGPLGPPTSMKLIQLVHRSGSTGYVYALDFARAALTYVFAVDDATGKVSGIRFSNAE